MHLFGFLQTQKICLRYLFTHFSHSSEQITTVTISNYFLKLVFCSLLLHFYSNINNSIHSVNSAATVTSMKLFATILINQFPFWLILCLLFLSILLIGLGKNWMGVRISNYTFTKNGFNPSPKRFVSDVGTPES